MTDELTANQITQLPAAQIEATQTEGDQKADQKQAVSESSEAHQEPTPENTAIFQAVGMITGLVKFDSEGKASVTIAGKEYKLFYAPNKKRAFEGFKKEVEATNNHTQRLIVYPKIMHFPKREQPHQMAFQLVGFDCGRSDEGISRELGDLEFKLSGLWQFIPVCQTPCVSVFRNFSDDRLTYIKQAELSTKVKFMKASHVPVIWKDAPIRPFRFNPKLDKEQQGHPGFIQIKVKFLPQRDVFGFVELLADPLEKAPKFFKVSKKDKAESQAIAKAERKAKGLDQPQPKRNSNQRTTSAPSGSPKPKPVVKPRPKNTESN